MLASGVLALAAWAAAVAAPVGAPAAAAPTVTVRVDPPEATVGDVVTATIEVEGAAGGKVAFPEGMKSWGKASVLSSRTLPPEPAGGGRERQRQELRIAAYEPGTLSLPPVEVKLGEGTTAETLSTPEATLTVRSVLAQGTEAALSDLRPPWSPPPPARWPLVLAGAAVAAAAVLGILAWRRRRRPASSRAEPAVPLLPPDEEALRAIAALLAGPSLARGRVKEFHVELAEIVKRYLHRRYGVPTLERTTFEVLGDARRAELGDGVIAPLARILEGCDAVKFARARPPAEECRARAEVARDLVVRTRPAPTTPAATPVEA